MSSKRTLVSLVAESYVTDGTLDLIAQDNCFIEDHREFDGLIADLDAHEEALRQVESIQNVVQTKVEEGVPLSQGAAEMVNVVMESIHRRVFRTPYQSVMPALEHFAEKHTSTVATRIATESIGESIIKFAKKIVEMISKIWERIKEFLSKIFGRRTSIKAGLEDSIKKVEAIPHDAKPDVKMLTMVAKEDAVDELQSYLMHQVPFGINGRCDGITTREIVEDTQTWVQANREIVLHIVSCLKKIDSNPIDYPELETEIDDLVKQIKDRLNQVGLNHKKNDGNKVIYSFGHFVNQQHCEVEEFVGLAHSDDRPRLFNLEVFFDKVDNEHPYTPAILERDEMRQLALTSLKLLTKAEDLDKVIPIVEKVLKGTLAFLENRLQPGMKNDPKEVTMAINAVKDMIRYIARNLPKLSGDTNRVAVGIQDYIKLCVPHYRTA